MSEEQSASDSVAPVKKPALTELEFRGRCEELLGQVYGERAQVTTDRLIRVIEGRDFCRLRPRKEGWDESDLLLITYGNSIIDDEIPPLACLSEFLHQNLQGCISGVHILPFFPYSSDDGFSVIDFSEVNPALGNWDHVTRLGEDFDLMFDLVINHVSRESLWFVDFLSNSGPGRNFFIDVDPDTDVSMVTRPRSTDLLVPVPTRRGVRHLWATFSEDQIDLDFSNPDVLVMMIGVLVDYLKRGANIIRLDAIAFLWKELGTPCVHLPQTHAIVKLLRTIMEYVAPGSLMITETNVPNRENLSYFGDGDEAHMVYQFTLPPLLLHTMLSGDASKLTEWARSLPELGPNCTFFNFTASHDGIGVRPVEGIISTRDLEDMVDSMHRFGGFVSTRHGPDGVETPYEINIAWFDAMQGTRHGPDQLQVSRFLCSQTVMLGMRGIPAVYIHSLVAAPNDLEAVEATGRLRTINRRRWHREDLDALLKTPTIPNRDVFDEMRRLMRVRRQEPCFNPEVGQQVLDLGDAGFGFLRQRSEPRRTLLALHNITEQIQSFDLQACELELDGVWQDLISGHNMRRGIQQVKLRPYQCMWLLKL